MMVDQRQGKGEYIQWRPEESKLLIELVANCFKEGWVDPSGKMFKKTVETKILSVLNEKFNSRKTYKNFNNRMKILKNQYRDFVNLLHFDSKVQWNPITKKFTAPDEVWNAYLRDFPNQRHVRNETYEEYENMKVVFGGMRRFARLHSQPSEVRKNEILKQEVDLTKDDDDDEVHEIRETEAVVFGDSSNYASVKDNDLLAKICTELRSVESATKQMIHIMQGRSMVEENKKINVWEAIKEIPNLSNHVQYEALSMIQKLQMGDIFVNMSVEDRLGWIQWNTQRKT
ncbi:Uncharacterized protein Rs2_46895 [Raphanus sativus]|uniref:Uncharacterized protein At2g29880-like n=1 Tax=Raphanus sativus TaxID=3726 RepID=A0A6J0JV34_RAPSA|nr:uncharacterized protein At2g29880-like [Raphanus sativus]XP_056853420.1 uncharacterized protein At2g29880-like [Raphanus sativus]XP_056853421.1 uncharacterized protein At2g29880-like [Raphanus sativus]KAJ4871470.1 Uncharacterized protein Rs2_46895 [Raphanus sativus]